MAQKAAMIAVLLSEDEGQTWRPIRPVDVPEWVKAPDVMGMLVAGQIAHLESDPGKQYRGEVLETSKLVIPEIRMARARH